MAINSFLAILLCFFSLQTQAQGLLYEDLLTQAQQTPFASKATHDTTAADIYNFMLNNKILDKNTLDRALYESHVFQFNNENMSGAFLLRVLHQLGTKPSRGLDLIYNKYLSQIFVKYENQFTQWLATTKDTLEIPALFGLPDSMSAFVKNETLILNTEAKTALLNLLHQTFQRSTNIDLNFSNRLLIQMVYIFEAGSIKNGISPEQLSTYIEATRVLKVMYEMKHSFVLTVGQWDITNIVAQWFSKVTVNMIPEKLGSIIEVHLNGGFKDIEGLAHDHGHVYLSRLKAIEELFLKYGNPNDRKYSQGLPDSIAKIESLIEKILISSLEQLKRNQGETLDGSQLINTIFFIIHEPKAFSLLMEQIILNPMTNWSKNSPEVMDMAHHLTELLKQNHSLYPTLKDDYFKFEEMARIFVTEFGNASKRWQLSQWLKAQSPKPLSYEQLSRADLKQYAGVRLDSNLVVGSAHSHVNWVLPDQHGNVAYFHVNNKLEILLGNNRLPQQELTDHPHGFSSPVGRLAAMPDTPTHKLNAKQWNNLGLSKKGDAVILRYASGVIVEGTLEAFTNQKGERKTVLDSDDNILILTLAEATATYNGKELYAKDWGLFDIVMSDGIVRLIPHSK